MTPMVLKHQPPIALEQYMPVALVQVIEHRHCTNCGATHHIAAMDVCVELKHLRDNSRVLRNRHDPKIEVPVDLVQRKEHVNTTSDACINCFAEHDRRQLELFRRTPPKVYILSELRQPRYSEHGDLEVPPPPDKKPTRKREPENTYVPSLNEL